MENRKYVLKELTKQNKLIYVSGGTMGINLIYIEALKNDEVDKIYLNIDGDISIIEIDKNVFDLKKWINENKGRLRLKHKYRFHREPLKTIAELIEENKDLTLKECYNITENLILSLYIDIHLYKSNPKYKPHINEDMLKSIFENEIIKKFRGISN